MARPLPVRRGGGHPRYFRLVIRARRLCVRGAARAAGVPREHHVHTRWYALRRQLGLRWHYRIDPHTAQAPSGFRRAARSAADRFSGFSRMKSLTLFGCAPTTSPPSVSTFPVRTRAASSKAFACTQVPANSAQRCRASTPRATTLQSALTARPMSRTRLRRRFCVCRPGRESRDMGR
jgi:hypothetical protein